MASVAKRWAVSFHHVFAVLSLACAQLWSRQSRRLHALAWTFDKLGPIARYVDDLGIVFSHLVGPDGLDPSVVERDFQWPDTTAISS